MHQALAFLTPIGGSAPPSPRAIAWFPPVGALIGLAVGAIWWGASSLWALPIAAALAVLADVALTGMLHLDGLADSADALLPPVDRARRLEILRDPRAGVFGVTAIVAVLLVRFAAFASIAPNGRTTFAIAGLWAASRTAMAVTMTVVPYAKASGLASAFGGASPITPLVIGTTLSLALGYVGTEPGSRGVLAVIACAIGAAAVVAFARGRLGGFTGDVLGACGVIGETVGLLVLAIHA